MQLMYLAELEANLGASGGESYWGSAYLSPACLLVLVRLVDAHLLLKRGNKKK